MDKTPAEVMYQARIIARTALNLQQGSAADAIPLVEDNCEEGLVKETALEILRSIAHKQSGE